MRSTAHAGDSLRIRGTCVGNFDIPEGADLSMFGARSGGALEGTGSGGLNGPVLQVLDGATLAMKELEVFNGGIQSDALSPLGGGIFSGPTAKTVIDRGARIYSNSPNNCTGCR